ncbi:TNF receptor-associated factor 4 [Lingula anatina]|uniref:TNF receptor-associated factor 4 n=1 Tax=Lingula anatina TaxID=7574 RepID=A0A1S3KE24_LINAN|nr:TNF receptor-associated factor 4 [Lingula anatina]|eukprot:XP_013420704.1 TNF receptor-associated factor 4 [Lingula anatina]
MPEKVDGSPTGSGGSRNSRHLGSALSSVSRNSNGSLVSDRPNLEITFQEPLEKKYECPVCCQVLRYPIQFDECGHRCCSSCLPELLRVAPRCPIDQRHIDRDKVYVDKAFQRDIDHLGVKCSNGRCKWTGALKELVPHQEDCKYKVIPCPKGCGAEFEKRFLDKHRDEDCPKRKIACEFCKSNILFEEEIEHLNLCKRFPIPCPNGCKRKDIPREEVAEHMEGDCPKQTVPCPFVDCGCEYRCNRKKLTAHVNEEPTMHLSLVAETIARHKEILDKYKLSMEDHTEKLAGMEKRIEGLEKLYGAQFVWKIDSYQEKLDEAKAGTKRTIFSQPFLTSRNGYKMALSACLFGDGKARGKFMSLFACICKGESDALLSWPFSHRVTFTLMDQCEDPAARRNVTYTVKPNTCKDNKPFLGRPSGDRNASFGAQKFVELEVMSTLDYIRDDTIFIKVNVDMDDMVKM